MDLETIRNICLQLPHVQEDIKWDTHVCFSIGGKMFIITSPDQFPVSASFKVSDEDFEELSQSEGCGPAPYLARYKWIKVDDLNRFSAKRWKTLLAEGYALVYEKLPPKVKKLLV